MATSTPIHPGPDPPTRSLPVAGPVLPPFPLIATHFAVAFAWALAGGIGLVWLAPTLATGTFLDPRVLALTHTITLGFLTTTIMGVLYQIYPAMLGVGCRSLNVAWWSLAAQTAGTALLVSGLLLGRGWLLGWGWTVLFAATFGVAWNVLPLRRRAPRNRQLGAYVSYAHTAFGLAMAVAGTRIGDVLGWWTTPRLELLAAHFQFAAVGFGGLTAMGVGSRMIPMFLGAGARDGWELKWIPRIVLSGTVVFAAGALARSSAVGWIGAALMAAGTGLFVRLAWGWVRARAARRVDPTTLLIGAALVSLAAAVPLGLGALAAGLTRPGLQAAYPVLVVLGWLTGLIIGVSFRVLPTLTFHHRFATRAGEAGIPALPDLLAPRLGMPAAVAHTAGVLLLVPALVLGSGAFARLGAFLFALAVLLTVLHHARMAIIRRVPPRAGSPEPGAP
jgi:hypothetical protein